MWDINGRLDPERAKIIHDLLRRQAAKTVGTRPITPNDMATALFDLTTNHTDDKNNGVRDGVGRPAPRMGIGYIVDADTLFHHPPPATTDSRQQPHEAWPTGTPDGGPGRRRGRGRRVSETWEGDDIEPATVQRLACDADLYAILIDKLGLPTAVGRTRRSATREQRLQLRALYDKCPLDGITPFARCEIHHVNVFFEDVGHTDIENLVPLSAEWHHKIHDRNWTLKTGPDRELHLWRPDGTHERTVAPPIPTTRRSPDSPGAPGPQT